MSFDPFSARPRHFCEDCGGALDWGNLELARRHLKLSELAEFIEFCGPQASVYRCPDCGLLGAFSPAMWSL